MDKDITDLIKISEPIQLTGSPSPRARHAPVKAEKLYINLFHHLSCAVIMYDLEGNIIDINRKALTLFGYTESEFRHIKIRQLHPESALERSKEAFDAVSKRGTVNFQIAFKRKTGDIFPAEVSASLFEIDGKAIVQAMVRDITEHKRIEDELMMFRMGIERSDEAIFLTDVDGRIVYVNPAFERIYGYSPEEVLGSTPRILKSGLMDEQSYEEFWGSLLSKKVVKGEILNRAKDGHLLHIEGSANPVLDQNGRITGFLAIQRDISGRKKAEEKIEYQNDFLKNIIESLSHPLFVIDAETYEILLANSASGLGKSAGKCPCYSAIRNNSAPCDDARHKCPLEILKTTKAPVRVEHEYVDEDGNLRFKEVHAYPIFDEEGDVAQMIEYSIDITERKKAEEQLQMEKAYFEQLFQSAPEAIVVVDNEGHIMRANGEFERIFGYEFSEIQNSSIDELLGADLYYWEARRATQRLAEGEQVSMETKRRRKDGAYVDVSILATPVRVGGGQVAVCAIYRDITGRKRYETERQRLREKLINAQRMESLGVLAGGVAHDLNNILGPLVVYPQIILGKLPDDHPIRGHIVKIEKSAQHAADIVQDLLTLARRGRYELKPVDLNELVNAYLKSPAFQTILSKNPSVKLLLDLAKPPPIVHGSSTHLFKAIMNLVINAFDAMPDGGELTIRTECKEIDRLMGGFSNIEPGKYVLISVRDTGVGINEADQKRIFEPFFSRKNLGRSGSGLGLAIVYGVTKDHNGYVDVISEPNMGSVFYLYFPAVIGEALTEARAENTNIKGDERILIVDDMPEQRELAATVLSSLGYNVDTAASGEDAVKCLQEQKFDVVVLDMIMEPGMDGLDTYKEILKIRPDQKAIISTGFSETDRVRQAEKIGVGMTIRKPYTMQTLGRAIREVLRSLNRSPQENTGS